MRIVERNEWPDIAGGVIPRVLGCILDGNGRWAEMRDQPRIEGHLAGGDALRSTIQSCLDLGISALAVYAFSYHNWARDVEEVKHLMGFYTWLITRDDLDWFERDGVRVDFFGDLDDDRLPSQTTAWITECVDRTSAGSNLRLIVVFNANERMTSGADEIPQVDLLVRTGGDERLSSFLPLNTQYAELLFIDTLWPDFRKGHLMSAIHEFQARSRRFGDARPSYPQHLSPE